MSNNTKKTESNLLSPLVDALWESGCLVWKLISNNPNKVDWREEFLALGVKNGNEETPRYLSRNEDDYRIEYLFSLPMGLTVEKVENSISRVATIFAKEIEYISVERFFDKVKIVVDKGVFEKEIFAFEDLEFEPTKNSLKIPIGYYLKDGKLQLLCLDLSSPTQCHMMIAGTSGYGKTNIFKCILSILTKFYSSEDIEYVLCDLKGTEGYLFANTKHCINYTDSPYETAEIIKETIREMDTRYNILKKAGCKDIQAYRNKGNKMPRRILCIDEFGDLTLLASAGDVDDSIISDLARLLQKGRSAGIICIFAMQTAKATFIPTEIRNNMPLSIGVGCRDGNQSKSITGDSEILATLKDRPSGMCMVFGLPRFDNTTLIKSIYMPGTEEELEGILKPFYKKQKEEEIFSTNSLTENIITKQVSGFDLNKTELFKSFEPKAKKKRKPHSAKKKVNLDKFDEII